MQCPKCSVEMDEVNKLGVIIDACSRCGGVWLDKGELDKIRAAEAGAREETSEGMEREHHHGHDEEKHHGHREEHDHGRHEKHGGHGHGQKKKKRGGFMDIFESFGGE